MGDLLSTASTQQQGLPVPRQQLLSWYSSLSKQVGTPCCLTFDPAPPLQEA